MWLWVGGSGMASLWRYIGTEVWTTSRKEQVGSSLELTWQDLDIHLSHPLLRIDFYFFSLSEYLHSGVQAPKSVWWTELRFLLFLRRFGCHLPFFLQAMTSLSPCMVLKLFSLSPLLFLFPNSWFLFLSFSPFGNQLCWGRIWGDIYISHPIFCHTE